MSTQQKNIELIGVGLYSIPEAAKLLSLQLGQPLRGRKLRRIGRGYDYNYEGSLRRSAPIVDSRIELNGHHLFTFYELVELLVIGAFQKEGVSLKVIRAAHERAKKLFSSRHPFALRRFDTNGRTIFAEIDPREVGDIDGDRFTVELSRGQVAFDQIVRPFFKNLDYVDDLAQRFWPMGANRSVVMDPHRNFGKPINCETGVPTAVLYAMYNGGSSADVIADWYEVPIRGVKDAIDYEEELRTAA